MVNINVGDEVVECERVRNGAVRKRTAKTVGRFLGTVLRLADNEVEIRGSDGKVFYRPISNYVAPTKVRQDFPSTFTF